jgi:hypothetical protein
MMKQAKEAAKEIQKSRGRARIIADHSHRRIRKLYYVRCGYRALEGNDDDDATGGDDIASNPFTV